MSLEERLAENTAALKANTAALLGKAAPAASASDKMINKAAADKVAKDETKAAPAKTKKITLDSIKEAFGGYLAVEDKKVRKERIGHVQAIVDHFGVSKASELEEDNWVEALGYLKQYQAGETPNFSAEDGGDEGDGDDALV